MKRTMRVLLLLVLVSPLLGAGGINPPFPADSKLQGPALAGTLVLDPHMALVTSNAKRATVYLRKGSGEVASAVFDVPATVLYFCGCDLNLTELRFLDKALTTFVPAAVVNQLLAELDLALPAGAVPMITGIQDAACSVDPANPANTLDPNGELTLIGPASPCAVGTATFPGASPVAGVFSTEFVVQFLVPSPRQN